MSTTRDVRVWLRSVNCKARWLGHKPCWLVRVTANIHGFRVGHRRKRARQGRTQNEGIASLTAPPVSTVAEEVVMLLRKLHSLPDWNSSINGYVKQMLASLGNLKLLIRIISICSNMLCYVFPYQYRPYTVWEYFQHIAVLCHNVHEHRALFDKAVKTRVNRTFFAL